MQNPASFSPAAKTKLLNCNAYIGANRIVEALKRRHDFNSSAKAGLSDFKKIGFSDAQFKRLSEILANDKELGKENFIKSDVAYELGYRMVVPFYFSVLAAQAQILEPLDTGAYFEVVSALKGTRNSFLYRHIAWGNPKLNVDFIGPALSKIGKEEGARFFDAMWGELCSLGRNWASKAVNPVIESMPNVHIITHGLHDVLHFIKAIRERYFPE